MILTMTSNTEGKFNLKIIKTILLKIVFPIKKIVDITIGMLEPNRQIKQLSAIAQDIIQTRAKMTSAPSKTLIVTRVTAKMKYNTRRRIVRIAPKEVHQIGQTVSVIKESKKVSRDF